VKYSSTTPNGARYGSETESSLPRTDVAYGGDHIRESGLVARDP